MDRFCLRNIYSKKKQKVEENNNKKRKYLEVFYQTNT